MDSPLRGILEWLFLETGPIKIRIPEDSNNFCYIDYTLIIYPRNIDWTNIKDKLNKTSPIINFTRELEAKNISPFLKYFTKKYKQQSKI